MNNIKIAAQFLRDEKVVAIPTETVYGLAGNAYSEKAIKEIFSVKNRPHYNPLIVHIKNVSELSNIATNIPTMALDLAKAFWPGPLTLVLDKQANISNWVTGGKPTVAIRVPAHPVALKLLNELDFPLVAPSANPFNYLSPTSAQHVKDQLNDKIPFILDGGDCEKGVESTIIGFKDDKPVLLRLGAVALEDIEKVTGSLNILNTSENTPDAPGMLSKHYSPTTKFCLTNNSEELLNIYNGKKIGTLVFQNKIPNSSIFHQEVLSQNGDLSEAAAHLFSALHRLDKMDLDVIISEQFPNEGLGKTINDRLKRASNVNYSKKILPNTIS